MPIPRLTDLADYLGSRQALIPAMFSGNLLGLYRGYKLKDQIKILLALTSYYWVKIMRRTTAFSDVTTGQPIRGAITLRSWDNHIFLVYLPYTDPRVATAAHEFYELKRWFYPNIGGVFVDVGAYAGGYTVRACNRSDLVIAIEPQSFMFKILEANVRINCKGNNVILVKKAVSDKKGKTFIGEDVETDTLDNILESMGVNSVDFVKIDIEGAEALALRGMKRTLRSVKYLLIEIQNYNTHVIKEIMSLGFRLIDVKKYGNHYGNYFFSKS